MNELRSFALACALAASAIVPAAAPAQTHTIGVLECGTRAAFEPLLAALRAKAQAIFAPTA